MANSLLDKAIEMYGVREGVSAPTQNTTKKRETSLLDKAVEMYGEKKKPVAQAVMQNKSNVGGTFLGGYKVTPQKEKREYTAEDYAAYLKQLEEEEKRQQYLETLDLNEQQKQIDAVAEKVDSAAKLNIHAFGAYDANNKTDDERQLATLQRDYNEAESIQYDMEGARVLDSLDEETRKLVEDFTTGSRVEGMNGWAAEKALLGKGYTEEEILQMADYRSRQINKEKMDAAVQKSIDFANSGAASEFVGSVWSVPQNISGGVTGSLSLGLQNLQNWISGSDRPVDYNAAAFRGVKKATAFREQVAQNIYERADTEAGGEINAFLYQTGMSMADSAAVYGMSLMGVPAWAGTAMLSSSAAVNGALEAKERGATDEQALAVGIFSGAAEFVFEKVSLDNLLKMGIPKGSVFKQVTQALKNAGIQGAIEGSEEVATTIANAITDAIVMGDLSAINQAIEAYRAQGMTETEAKQKAYADFAKEVGLSFVGGFLSGGIMGGVAGNLNELAQNKAYGEMYGESIEDLTAEALEINPESETAKRVQEKYGAGKKISGGEVRELVLENQKAIDKAQREAEMAEQAKRNAPPTAKVETDISLPDGRKVSAYTSDENGNAIWVTDSGTVKGGEQDNTVVGAANKWGGDIGRVIVEQYNGMDEATYSSAADVFVELGIQSADGDMTWEKAAEITGAFVDEVGLEQAHALYSAGMGAARSPAFRSYYHAGLLGNEMGNVSVQGKSWLSDAVKQYAYELGQAHAKDEKRHKYVVSKKAGFDAAYAMRDDAGATAAKNLSNNTRKMLDRIGKALGVEIRFATESDHLSDDANGLYDASTGTIIISPNASNPVMVVVAHEVTHRLQDMDFEAYKQYRKFVIGKMEQRTGTTAVTKIRDRYRSFYKNNSFTDLEAMDELVADYTLAMIEDGKLFAELKEDNRSVARKLWDALKSVLTKATETKNFSLYGTTLSELREAETMWRKMLDGKVKPEDEGNVFDAIVGTRHSLKDSDYLAAVERGDMDTAQKMVDEAAKAAGYTIKGHHGTTNLFTVFDTSKSNIENDWGRGIYATTSEEDAETNYASDDGADLTNRIERLAEMMENWEEYEDMDYEQRVEAARNQLSQGENRMLRVAIRMENPVVVERGSNGTFFTYESEYDEDADEYSEPSGTLLEVVEQMQSIIEEEYEWASYDADKLNDLFMEAIDYGGMSAIQLQSAVDDALIDVSDEDGNLAGKEILRAALERMGFDGIIDKSVPYKFGELSGRRYGGMRGVAKDTTHYIAFNSSQVKLADPVTYDDNGNVIPLSERFNAENDDIRFSLKRNDELMQEAEDYNNSHLGINLDQARQQRQEIYDFMMANLDRLKMPEDIEDNTAVKNSSYDITEENTTVCIRSMAADALCDAIAESLGRPLTVQDTLLISQDLMNYTDEPECVYCYVATDRRAYREFLGSYYKQMQSAIDAIKSGKNIEDVYQTFLDGRKDTKNMRNRFAMWREIANGGKMISAKDLASEKMMQEAMKDPALAPQVKDARAYAQSASWAKKRVGYRSYNGHILEWTQRRINDLNKHYGLRFYSFSDFSPAFILENMQQMTDAAVRGLKGLAYTKVLDFAEIFAPTGININISVFGYSQNGTVAQDGMMGADWKGAQNLRNRYENVGITFVATNDSQIEWALEQDWIDVVIPYHLVRTGQAVAKHFGYTNYTAESGDTKGANWKKGDKKTIYPAEHNNDKQTYLDALSKANLEPRFARWVDHPNYMKLVNETRRAASDTPPIQAVFNVDAAKASLERMAKQGGYFVPIGGDYANMQDIADEIADKIRAESRMSLKSDAAMGNTLHDMAEAEAATQKAVKTWIQDVHRGKKIEVSYQEAERVAKRLMSDYRSTADAYDVTGAVLDLFHYMQNGDNNRNMNATTVQEKAQAVVDALLSDEMRGYYYTADYEQTAYGLEMNDMAQDNEELRAFLRDTKIVYPKEYVSDLGTETWTSFTDGLKGARARLSDDNNRANVDTLYRQDLSQMWPQYFPDSVTGEAAMMQRIAEVSQRVFAREPKQRDMSNSDAVRRLATADVLDRFFDLPQVGKTYMSVRNLWERTSDLRKLHDNMLKSKRPTSLATIIKQVRALDRKLRDNTEKSHVPDELRQPVLEMCSLFTKNTSVFEKAKLASIKMDYDALAEAGLTPFYDEEISDMLEEMARVLNGRRLSQLKPYELVLVGNVVDHFSHLVNRSNEAFVNGRKAEISAMAENVLAKAATDKPAKSLGSDNDKVDAAERFFTTGNEKPLYMFRRIGGEMQALFEDVLRGQSRYGLLMEAANNYRKNVYEKYNADKWINSKSTLEMTTTHGNDIKLTVREAMSLIALYKREMLNKEQDAGHLSKGGIVYESEMKRVIKNSKNEKEMLSRADVGAKPISYEDMLEISRWLRESVSANADAFIDEMVGYLSTTMADLGNETSMQLSGFRKYMEGYYFPYSVAKQYIETNISKQKDSRGARRSPGFSKRTVKKADAPIVLRDFMDVWSEHVSEMLTYSTIAVPQDNLLRVLNYKSVLLDEEDSTNINRSVKVAIQNTYGKHTLEYIEQLLRDMNGDLVSDSRDKLASTLVGIMKRNAVGLSLSVAIQQPSSVFRAMAHIDPKYFTFVSREGNYEELKKYSGVAVIKQIGGFDTNTGRGGARWLSGDEDVGSVVSDVIGWLPQKMDQMTWTYLWNVVKAETRDKHPDLLDNGKDTEALLKEAGKRFDEVVELTQVYDSVLTRTENMRAKGLTPLLVTFMSEPMVTLNMVADAVRSKDKKLIKHVAAALLVSIVMNNMLKAIVTGARDDDEDQTYIEKWLEKFTGYMATDILPTSYIPVVSDLVDILRGYSSSVELYEPIENLFKKGADALTNIQDYGAGEIFSEESLDFLLALPEVVGVPLENIKRDVMVLVNTFTKTVPLRETTSNGLRKAMQEGLGRESSVKESVRDGWMHNSNEKRRKKALSEIESIYNDKVKQYQAKGKTLEEAKKAARSSIMSACTSYLKPIYQEAKGVKKNDVKQFALRISVGGKQLYANYDFGSWDE